MPGLTLTFAVAAAVAHVIAVGSCLCGGNDDDHNPHDSYFSRSSLNGGTTRIRTQPSYRPPPSPPSYTHQPPATSAQTAPRTSVPPDYGRGIYHPSTVSSHTRTPSQTQPSSTRIQPSATFTQPSISQSASTGSRTLSSVPTERDRLLPAVSSGVYHSSVVSPYTRTPSQTQPSPARTQPSIAQSASTSSRVPPCVPIERGLIPTISSGVYRPSVVSPYTQTPSQTQRSPIAQSTSTSSRVLSCVPTERDTLSTVSSSLSPYNQTSSRTQPSSALTQPSSTLTRLSSTFTQASSTRAQPSYTLPQPSSARAQASCQHSSLFNTVHVDEPPPEYEYFQTSSHVPSRVLSTERDPLLPTIIQVVESDLRSNEPVGIEDLDFAKKLREQARRKGREMSEARSRAKSAQKKGYRGAAQVHRQEAITHESAMKELDKRAAKIIFRENNKNRKEGGKVDLHGLYVAEAVQFAKDQVEIARSRGDEAVQVHCWERVALRTPAGPKIRPALEDLFTKRGLTHSLDPKNAGVLVVRMNGQ
ncbi:hypothetical protein EDB83DRAFT_27041 [Lactarius deliciosus]|nr:hypothetical protein EDB83DRAFT_27041 [Lactarius deliciosus]